MSGFSRDPETCSVGACTLPARHRGWCNAHYERWRLTGDVQADRPVASHAPPEVRIERFIDRSTGDCWLWTGRLNNGGYGIFGKSKAHRRSYEIHVGPIPDGMELDHLCRNRACVNPDHLEPVTRTENVRRGWVARVGVEPETCPQGHELTPETTRPRSDTWRAVRCLVCRREVNRAYRARQKAKKGETA